MKKIILSLLLILFLSQSSFALKNDQKQNMLLMADKIKFDNKHKVGNYIGHVFLKQGTSTLKADTAWTYTDSNNQLKKAIAEGNNIRQALFETLLEGKKDKLKGSANKITYFPLKQQVYLEGNALLKQGKNKYQAPIIIYDIERQRLVSQKTTKHRSTIYIENEKKA